MATALKGERIAAGFGTGPAERGRGVGGSRLAAAFEAVSKLPALAQCHERLTRLATGPAPDGGELTAVVESDPGLTLAVLRQANGEGGRRRCASSVPDAIRRLGAGGTVAAVAALDTYELFEWDTGWYRLVDRFRSHAVATREAVERIGGLIRLEDATATATAALLHDLGKLVLTRLYARRTDLLADPRLTPEEALAAERSELGIDHPLVGGVLARRLALPEQTARAIELHHSDDAEGTAAAVRLADLIVHHSRGTAVESSAVEQAGAALDLGPGKLARLFYGSPDRLGEPAGGAQPCPLSMRERDALRGLAEGKVYKQIAEDLQLATSTVRSHLHHVYEKLGVHDRAQAVILARSRGWV